MAGQETLAPLHLLLLNAEFYPLALLWKGRLAHQGHSLNLGDGLMEVHLPPSLVPVHLIKDLVKDVKPPAPLPHMKLAVVKAISAAIGVIEP